MPNSFKFIFAGDTHGDINNMPRFVEHFNQQRKNNTESIAIFSGDFAGPTIESRHTRGGFDIEMLKHVYHKGDIITLGNHDFNYGEERLATLLKELNCEVVATNITLTPNSPLEGIIKSHHVIETSTGKIGFIGLITPETRKTSNMLKTVNILEEEYSKEAVKREIIILKEQGINSIVIISHFGFDLDRQLALEFPGVVIIGGHSHTVQKEIYRAENGTLVAHAGYNARYVGQLEVEFDNNAVICKQFNCIVMNQDLPENEAVKKAIALMDARIENELGITLDKTIVQTSGNLVYSGLDWDENKDSHQGQARYNDTFITRTMADAMHDFMRVQTGQDDYIALFHGGGVRSGLSAASITNRDLYNVLPFPQYLVSFEMSGEDLLIELEIGLGLTNWHQRSGILHPSAQLNYSYDLTKPRGQRLQSVLINGEPIDLNKKYKIVTNNWVASGQDGHQLFRDKYYNAGKVIEYKEMTQLRVFSNYLITYIEKLGTELNQNNEYFGSRIVAAPSLDECEVISLKPEYARGKESAITAEQVNLTKFRKTIEVSTPFNLLDGLRNSVNVTDYPTTQTQTTPPEKTDKQQPGNTFKYS